MIAASLHFVIAEVVSTDELLKTVVAAAISGTGISVLFSFAIYGMTRFADHSRDESPFFAAVFAALGIICAAAFIAAVVFGVVVMTTK